MKDYSGALDFDFVIFLTANLNGRYDTLDIFRPGYTRVYGSFLGYSVSIVFDGAGIQKILRRIFFVPSDYRSIDLHAERQACVFTKHLHRQRMKFDGFSEFSTGGHSRSLQFWYESTGNFTTNLSMIL